MVKALTQKELASCKEIIESAIFNIFEIIKNLEELNARYQNEEEIKELFDANENDIKNNINNFLKKVEIFYEFSEKLKSICEKNLKKLKSRENPLFSLTINDNENNSFELKDLIFLQNNILESLTSDLTIGGPFSLVDQNVLEQNNLEETQGKFANVKSNLTAYQDPIKELIQNYDRDDFFRFDNFEKIKKIPERIYNSENFQKQIIFINSLSEFDFKIKDYHNEIFNFFLEEKLENDKWLFNDLSHDPNLDLSKKFKINLLEKLLYAYQIQLNKQNAYEANQQTLEEFFNYLFEEINFNDLSQNDYSSISEKIKELMEIYKKNIENEKKEEEAVLTKGVKDKISSVSANLTKNFKPISSAVLFKVDKKNKTLYYVTNKHCIQDLERFSILIQDQKLHSFYPSQILKNDSSDEDIAFVEVKLNNSINIDLEDPEVFKGEIKENDIVIASGNTRGEQIYEKGTTFFTAGRVLKINSQNELNHNAKTDHGNDGGGLFNSEGKLIGINYAKNNTYGFGSAVPIGKVKEIFNNLHERKKQEVEQKQKAHFSKFKKHLGVFIIFDLIAASVIYFSMSKLIENNKLQNMNKNLAFGCIALVSIALLFFEIKALINDQKEILSTKTEIEGLETLIEDQSVPLSPKA